MKVGTVSCSCGVKQKFDAPPQLHAASAFQCMHALDTIDRRKWQTSKVYSCILCKLDNPHICGDCGPCMIYEAGLDGPGSFLPIMAAKSPFPSECSSDCRLCLHHLLRRGSFNTSELQRCFLNMKTGFT